MTPASACRTRPATSTSWNRRAPSCASAGTAASLANIYTFNLGLDYYAHYAEQVYAVTPDQALAAAKKYLVADRFVVVAIGDRAKIEPELKKLNLPIEIRDADGKVVK